MKLQEAHRAFCQAESRPGEHHALSPVRLKSLCCALNRVRAQFLREKKSDLIYIICCFEGSFFGGGAGSFVFP